MVFPGLGEERGTVPAPKSMAMGPKRSMPLHNFTFPCLKWGSQRYLRCTKAAADGAVVPHSGDRRSLASKCNDSTASWKRELEWPGDSRESDKRMRLSKSQIDDDGEEGIDAVREKLMRDLKDAADRMKDAILRKEVAVENEKEEEEQEESPPPPAAAVERPWNLRTRRAACKAPVTGDGGKVLKIEEKKPNHSPSKTDAAVKSSKFGGTSGETERVKFSVPLSRKEVEEDFMAMLDHRPPRRPKKRPRTVQNNLDTLFPGFCLTEVTVDSYRVPEAPEKGKRWQ